MKVTKFVKAGSLRGGLFLATQYGIVYKTIRSKGVYYVFYR